MMKKLILASLAVALMLATPALARNNGHGGHRHDDDWHGKPRVIWQHHAHSVKLVHTHSVKLVKVPRQARYYGYRPIPPGHRHHAHGYDHARRHDTDLLYAVLALQIVDLMNDNQRNNYAWAQGRAVTKDLRAFQQPKGHA